MKELRAFLGLSRYYRRFIKGYASIATPLTDLLQKDQFHWNDKATEAFNQLKRALCTAPILQLPNFCKPFIVEIDASGTGVGAVLLQQSQSVAYFSKKMPLHLRKASAYVRELHAIVDAVKKWR